MKCDKCGKRMTEHEVRSFLYGENLCKECSINIEYDLEEIDEFLN